MTTRRRGPDKRKRQVNPRSLENLVAQFPAVLDGKESVATRIRLGGQDLKRWSRLSSEERSRVVELGLRAWESGG